MPGCFEIMQICEILIFECLCSKSYKLVFAFSHICDFQCLMLLTIKKYSLHCTSKTQSTDKAIITNGWKKKRN